MTRHCDMLFRARAAARWRSELGRLARRSAATGCGDRRGLDDLPGWNPSTDGARSRPCPRTAIRTPMRSSLRRFPPDSIEKDDVLISNFNDAGNLQGLGTTIVNFQSDDQETHHLRRAASRSRRMSGRRRPVDCHDHAQERLGHRRQRTERRRHDGGPGARAASSCWTSYRQGRGHNPRRPDKIDMPWGNMAVIDNGDHRDPVRQHGRLRRPASRPRRSARRQPGDCASHQAHHSGGQTAGSRRSRR